MIVDWNKKGNDTPKEKQSDSLSLHFFFQDCLERVRDELVSSTLIEFVLELDPM